MEGISNFETQMRFLIACQHGNLEEVRYCLQDEDLDVNVKDPERDDQTGLISACQNGYLRVIELLLSDHRVNVNLEDRFGKTALYWSCFNGRGQAIKLLLRNEDLDLNQSSQDGWTPLMIGCWKLNFEVVIILLASKRELDIDLKNNEGKTALDIVKERRAEGRKITESEEEYNIRMKNCRIIQNSLELFQTPSSDDQPTKRPRLSCIFFFKKKRKSEN